MANEFIARNGITSLGNIVVSGSITTTGTVAISGSIASASFAATASSADNFLTRGTLTAQTLVVQTITSSVMYSSGSNIFGNNIANTQVLTGSVTVTGSLAVVTNGTEFQVTSTGVRLGNISADTHTITGSVNVSGSNTIVGDLTLSGNRNIYLSNTNPAAGAIRFFNTVSGSTKSAIGSYFNIADEGNLEFLTGGTSTRMVINSSGNVGIGTINPVLKLQVNAITGDGIYLNSFLTTTGATDTGAVLAFGLNDGSTNRDAVYIKGLKENGTSGNYASYLSFFTRPNGAGLAERMRIHSDGNMSIGNPTNTGDLLYLAGNLKMITNGKIDSNGGTLSINSATGGNVGVGVTSPSYKFHMAGGQYFMQATSLFSSYTSDGLWGTTASPSFIGSPGQVGSNSRYGVSGMLLGYQDNGSGLYSPAYGFEVKSTDGRPVTGNVVRAIVLRDTDSGTLVFFVNNNGNVQNVNNSYGSTSDISIKENIVDATPKLSNLMNVKIRNYNLKADPIKIKQIGVIAQELEEVFPGMIETDTEGLKSVKYSVFVPMLIKAIQELTARVQELENK